MNHSTTYVSTSYTPSETNAFEGAKRLFGGCGYPSFSQCDFTDEESSGEAFDRRLCESKSSEHYGFFWGLNFTGKETDCETGYSYFGARYYDPTLLTSWTAIDPMSDKYPNISPYAYCDWNPIVYHDPNGEEKLIWFNTQKPKMAKSDTKESYEIRLNTYKNNVRLDNYAKRFSDRPDIIHVFAHGDVKDGKTTGKLHYNDGLLSASKFSQDVLMKSETYMHSNDDNPCVIMLHCCNTGQGKSSFAQQLSASGALVIAPSDECNISVNHQNKESVNNGGVWNVFLNGEKLVSLKGDESNTKRILNFLKDKTPETVYQYFKTKYAKNDE